MSFSTRYAIPIALASVLALVPVVIHRYAQVEIDDCRNPGALTPGGQDPAADKREEWLRERYAAFAWREGSISRRPVPLHYVVARSYDAKRIYYRSSYSLATGPEPLGVKLEEIEIRGAKLPVFETLFPPVRPGKPQQVAFHVLVSEGELISRPIRHQLLNAPRRLLTGRRPMTLIYVDTLATNETRAEAREAALDWLARSWENYRAYCS